MLGPLMLSRFYICLFQLKITFVNLPTIMEKSINLIFYPSWSESDLKPVGHKPGIREEGHSTQLRTSLLHVPESLSTLSHPLGKVGVVRAWARGFSSSGVGRRRAGPGPAG